MPRGGFSLLGLEESDVRVDPKIGRALVPPSHLFHMLYWDDYYTPQKNTHPRWAKKNPRLFRHILKYMSAGYPCGYHHKPARCRLCHKKLGTHDIASPDMRFVWPEGAEHYLTHHDVVPPFAFQNHVRNLSRCGVSVMTAAWMTHGQICVEGQWHDGYLDRRVGEVSLVVRFRHPQCGLLEISLGSLEPSMWRVFDVDE